LTVVELFRKAKAKLSGQSPVPWGTPISECSEGVYVVARVGNANGGCEACELPFKDPLPSNLVLNPEYERQRWLPNEPVLYIGGTTRSLCVRIAEFYCHKVGNKRPHAGGQVVKLLGCDLWVYWSHANDPWDLEFVMLCAFRKKAGQLPFGNEIHGKPKRIRCST